MRIFFNLQDFSKENKDKKKQEKRKKRKRGQKNEQENLPKRIVLYNKDVEVKPLIDFALKIINFLFRNLILDLPFRCVYFDQLEKHLEFLIKELQMTFLILQKVHLCIEYIVDKLVLPNKNKYCDSKKKEKAKKLEGIVK